MIKEIADYVYRIKDNPAYWWSNWHYEFEKLLQNHEFLPSEDWSPIDTCFIISTGRTGTKFLAKLFDQYDDIFSIHEPDPDFLELGIGYAKGKYSFKTSKREINMNRRALCKKVKREKCSTYIESNNRLFSLIDVLIEEFANPKILHIVRDGREYVRSGMSRSYGGYYSKEDPFPRIKANYFPEDPYYEKWEDMSQFEKICWLWQKKDGYILNDVENYDNTITVKFEDVFKQKGSPGLRKIANFLDFDENELKSKFADMESNRINKTKEYKIPKWEEWNKNMIKSFDEIAGEHMKNYYNYERIYEKD